MGRRSARTSSSSASGSRARNRSMVRYASSHAQAVVAPGPQPDVGVAPLVARPGPDDGARAAGAGSRSPVGGAASGSSRRRRRRRRRAPGPGRASRRSTRRPVAGQVGGVGHRHPPAVGVDHLGDDQVGRHQRGPVHAVDGAGGGRRGEVEPGVAGQGQLGGRAGEAPAHPLGVGVLHRDAQLGGGLDVDGGVGLVRADEAGVELGELLGAAEGSSEGAEGQGGLLLDVEPGEHEGHRVAPTAQQVEADLHVGRGRAAPDCREIRTRSGPCWSTRDGVEAGHHVGVGVVGAGDLVEELGGDRAHRHLAAGARVLGDHRRAVRGHLGDGEAGMLERRRPR